MVQKPPHQKVVQLKTSVSVPEDTIYLQFHLRAEHPPGTFHEFSSQPLALTSALAQDLAEQLARQLGLLRTAKEQSSTPPSQKH